MPNSPIKLPCAVIQAGADLCLAINFREGRYPVRLLRTEPCIDWVCSDGTVEQLDLDGPASAQSRQQLAAEIKTRALLVTEVDQLPTFGPGSGRSWLLSASPVA